MNRIEFMEKLQRALAGGLNSRQVTENVRYYQEYIDMEIRKGKSEAEVLSGLGDPRLLAKSIIEANKRAGRSEGTNLNYDEEIGDSGTGTGGSYSNTYHYQTNGDYENRERASYEEDMAGAGKIFRVPGWLLLLIITVFVLLIIGVAFSLISVLAPILIPVLVITLIVKLFQSNR
ncbi:MAG: DUF1700 domain-containing protein [Lachnospiraceae bacterium]|nr:DUF1700 domain-containing protein [Lachnospiraceae bacterium]